ALSVSRDAGESATMPEIVVDEPPTNNRPQLRTQPRRAAWQKAWQATQILRRSDELNRFAITGGCALIDCAVRRSGPARCQPFAAGVGALDRRDDRRKGLIDDELDGL